MKICLLVSIAGLAEPRYDLPDFAFQPGEMVTLHPALAQAWIAAGHAEAVPVPSDSKLKKAKK